MYTFGAAGVWALTGRVPNDDFERHAVPYEHDTVAFAASEYARENRF